MLHRVTVIFDAGITGNAALRSELVEAKGIAQALSVANECLRLQLGEKAKEKQTFEPFEFPPLNNVPPGFRSEKMPYPNKLTKSQKDLPDFLANST